MNEGCCAAGLAYNQLCSVIGLIENRARIVATSAARPAYRWKLVMNHLDDFAFDLVIVVRIVHCPNLRRRNSAFYLFLGV
jgi:hypothetical protein